MAYISGKAGTVTFTGTSGPTIFAPTEGTTFSLVSWEVISEADTFEAEAKADNWVTIFSKAARWYGRMTFLAHDILAAGEDDNFVVRGPTTAEKTFDAVFKTTADADGFTGTGLITNVTTLSPDGAPVEVTVEFKGGSPGTSDTTRSVAYAGTGS